MFRATDFRTLQAKCKDAMINDMLSKLRSKTSLQRFVFCLFLCVCPMETLSMVDLCLTLVMCNPWHNTKENKGSVA